MKLNKELEILLNNQINMELAASYQYQAMAAYFDERALEGFAKWMDNQAKEEMEHSRKFYNYVLKRNGKIEFFALDKPKMDFTSVKEVFEQHLLTKNLLQLQLKIFTNLLENWEIMEQKYF